MNVVKIHSQKYLPFLQQAVEDGVRQGSLLRPEVINEQGFVVLTGEAHVRHLSDEKPSDHQSLIFKGLAQGVGIPVDPSAVYFSCNHVFIVQRNGNTIGTMILTLFAQGKRNATLLNKFMCAELSYFFVDPDYRQQGVGHAMVKHALMFARVRGNIPVYALVIRKDTINPSERLLARCGFSLHSVQSHTTSVAVFLLDRRPQERSNMVDTHPNRVTRSLLETV